MINLFSFYFVIGVVLAIEGDELPEDPLDDCELRLPPVLDCPQQDLLPVPLVAKVHSPQLQRSLRLRIVAPHEVVPDLLIRLVPPLHERVVELLTLVLRKCL